MLAKNKKMQIVCWHMADSRSKWKYVWPFQQP